MGRGACSTTLAHPRVAFSSHLHKRGRDRHRHDAPILLGQMPRNRRKRARARRRRRGGRGGDQHQGRDGAAHGGHRCGAAPPTLRHSDARAPPGPPGGAPRAPRILNLARHRRRCIRRPGPVRRGARVGTVCGQRSRDGRVRRPPGVPRRGRGRRRRRRRRRPPPRARQVAAARAHRRGARPRLPLSRALPSGRPCHVWCAHCVGGESGVGGWKGATSDDPLLPSLQAPRPSPRAAS